MGISSPLLVQAGFVVLLKEPFPPANQTWYSLTTFQLYENKKIPEGKQINEAN